MDLGLLDHGGLPIKQGGFWWVYTWWFGIEFLHFSHCWSGSTWINNSHFARDLRATRVVIQILKSDCFSYFLSPMSSNIFQPLHHLHLFLTSFRRGFIATAWMTGSPKQMVRRGLGHGISFRRHGVSNNVCHGQSLGKVFSIFFLMVMNSWGFIGIHGIFWSPVIRIHRS